MKPSLFLRLALSSLLCIILFTAFNTSVKRNNAVVKHYLYVAVPGIRDYLGFGGHGLLVFDMDNNHRFVKRIQTRGYHPIKRRPM